MKNHRGGNIDTRGYALLTSDNYSVERSLDDENIRVILAENNSHSLDELYRNCDAIVIPGGGDVNPKNYGQTANRETTTLDSKRDFVEIYLAKKALADGKPILGICRGHQVINIAAGGTLIQDIPSMIWKSEDHWMVGNHFIEILDDNWVYDKIFDGEFDFVNSLHHQCVDTIGAGLSAVAYASDGVIEAIVARDHPFALGVQFHPEMMAYNHYASQMIFGNLADAIYNHFSARSNRSRKRSGRIYGSQLSHQRWYSSYYQQSSYTMDDMPSGDDDDEETEALERWFREKNEELECAPYAQRTFLDRM